MGAIWRASISQGLEAAAVRRARESPSMAWALMDPMRHFSASASASGAVASAADEEDGDEEEEADERE